MVAFWFLLAYYCPKPGKNIERLTANQGSFAWELVASGGETAEKRGGLLIVYIYWQFSNQ